MLAYNILEVMLVKEEYENNTSTIVGLSIASGALILVGALLPFVWFSSIGFMPMMQGMMGMNFAPWMMNISWIAIVSGAIILFSGMMINRNPREAQKYGILILTFALVGIISMGGFLIGSILGIIAGALAIARRH